MDSRTDTRTVPRAVHGSIRGVHEVIAFFRKNPQVLALVVICLVLGIGTFLIVVFGLISSGSTKITGEPSGVVTLVSSLVA
jgi:hypothetical protein